MQNKLFAAIMTVLLVLAMAMPAMCAEDVTVSIGDGEGNVTIPIMVENVTNLGSCHILLTYDKDVVSVTDVTDGDMDLTVPNFVSNPGTITIMAYKVGGIGGNVIVANVTFTPVDVCSNATSDLNLTLTNLYEATDDKSAVAIPCNVDDGVYTSIYVGGLNGDASGDGNVTIHDALYIASYVVQLNGYEIVCPAIADVDGDGDVDIDDAKYLANYLAGDPDYNPLL